MQAFSLCSVKMKMGFTEDSQYFQLLAVERWTLPEQERHTAGCPTKGTADILHSSAILSSKTGSCSQTAQIARKNHMAWFPSRSGRPLRPHPHFGHPSSGSALHPQGTALPSIADLRAHTPTAESYGSGPWSQTADLGPALLEKKSACSYSMHDLYIVI